MGSIIEINDTLQLTPEQGFPVELNLEEHLKNPLQAKAFAGRVFEFKHKPRIRVYHAPPVRCFLVENRKGKWIYWGLVHMLELHHDLVTQDTSGKFRIVHINTPDEMKLAHKLIDRNPGSDWFGGDGLIE